MNAYAKEKKKILPKAVTKLARRIVKINAHHRTQTSLIIVVNDKSEKRV